METVEKKKSSWWKRIWATLLVLFLLFCLFVGYGVGINNKYYKLLIVTSNSMQDTFSAGDLIYITKIDSKKAKVGDIVTFKTRDGFLLTHRIVSIKSDSEIITKGDNNKYNDVWSDGWKLGKVETKYIFKIPKLGYAINWFQGLFGKTGASFNDSQKTEGNIQAE